MSYTQTDLDNVRSAIIALATGARVVRVSISDKIIEYGQAQLNQLRALRQEIMSEVNSNAGRRRFVLTRTSKGL